MYYGDFDGLECVLREFQIDSVGGEIVAAGYSQPSYEGYAKVVFLSGGKLWIVEGSHCSCYGLEGQWEPDEMPLEGLRKMANNGEDDYYGDPIWTIALGRLEELGVTCDEDLGNAETLLKVLS